MPLTKIKQGMEQDVNTSSKDTSDSDDPLIYEIQKGLRTISLNNHIQAFTQVSCH